MHTRVSRAEGSLLAALPARAYDELLAIAETVRLPAQDWLFREGDAADRLYLVAAGRLRVVVERDGVQRVARLLGAGTAIGELGVLTGTRRSASVQAVRDSELLEIDGERFLDLLGHDPDLSVGLVRALARQLQASGSVVEPDAHPTVFAVMPASGVESQDFCDDLCSAFVELGSTAAIDHPETQQWPRELSELEARHAFVVLLATTDDPEWTSFCLRQADRVLVIGSGPPARDAAPPEGCDIVFLDAPSADIVAAWRAVVRPRAHHVLDEDRHASAARVARRLVGRSLGLVLSGGGARAFAHVGVLQVLSEEGLVVDRVGGTSMGAFIGAMGALGWTPATMLEVCRTEVMQRAPFSDYTVPRHALIRARRAASMLRRLFGASTLEELPRSLYTVSADLLSGEMIVHREGGVVEAVGASMAIPGLAPPVSYGTRLLIDGGVLNNLPIDLMVEAERGPVVAVDVMRRIDLDELKSNARHALPTILETLSRATVLGSVDRARANRGLAQVLITPDVQQVPLRDFRHLDEAVDAGRRAAEDALAAGGKEALVAAFASAPSAPAAMPTA